MQYTFTYQGSAEKFVSSLIYEIKGNIQDTYGSYSINEPNDGKEYTLSKHIPDIKRIGNGYPRELVWNASIKTYGELQPDVLSDGTIIMLPEILTATYPTAVTFKLKQSLDGTTTIVTSTCHSDVWKPFFEWLLQQCGEMLEQVETVQKPSEVIKRLKLKAKWTEQDWRELFAECSPPGARPDYYEIEGLTGRKYSTIKEMYSRLFNRN